MELYRKPMAGVAARPMPGRLVREILSGRVSHAVGVGLRQVEIRPADPQSPRFPHVHRTMEEVMVITAGRGFTWVDGTWYPIGPGDALQVPAGAVHGTVNPGPDPLLMLCFFPSATPEADYTEYPELLLTDWGPFSDAQKEDLP